MADGSLHLAADFEPVGRDDWLAAVGEVLRGRPFDEALASTTRDGLTIEPLYTAADAEGDTAVFAVPADPGRIEGGWDIRQRHHVGDPAAGPAAASAAILDDLRNGVTSIELAAAVSEPGAAAADGLTGDAIAAALQGVDLMAVPVILAPHCDLEAACALAELTASAQPGPPAGAWLGLDPIGHNASAGHRSASGEQASGGFSSGEPDGQMPSPGEPAGPSEPTGNAGSQSVPSGLADAAALASELCGRLGPVRVFTVDGVRYANAGATPAQEIGWMLATGTAYLRALEQAGVAMPAAAASIGLRVSAGADQFATTAAVRALRGTWARVLEACGVARPEQSIGIQAVTAEAMFSRRDPWTNMLRCTSAVLGAVIGGADAITVLPHDALCSDAAAGDRDAQSSDAGAGPGDARSRRLARNVQLLLAEESQIARLADPAGGSWFAESLTARLAECAWAEFQEIEAAGGMESAVRSGSVAAAAERAAAERLETLATRRQAITGVSEYPEMPSAFALSDSSLGPLDHSSTEPRDFLGQAPDEGPPGGQPGSGDAKGADAQDPGPDESAATGVTVAGLHQAPPAGSPRDTQSPALPLRRPAAPFEALQDAAERAPQQPRVFAAALGDFATHTARSAWAANMLAVGGVELVGADGDGALSPLEAEASFTASGCEAAVICSTDAFYAERAAATATALKEAGARFVAIAAAPDGWAGLEAAGVDEFWHDGVDVLASLRRLHGILGVSGSAAADDHAVGPGKPTVTADSAGPGDPAAAAEPAAGPNDDSAQVKTDELP